jgi:hypothetical protein
MTGNEETTAPPGTLAFQSLPAEKRAGIVADLQRPELTNIRIAGLRGIPVSLVTEIRLRLRNGWAV